MTSDNAQAMIDRARQLIDNRQLNEAAEIYDYLTRRYPFSHDFVHLHGLVLYESGDMDTALKKISSAINLNPDHAVYHRSHGDVLQAMGKFKSAIQAYQRALSLNPSDIDTILNQGNALQRINAPDQARQCYLQVLQTNAEHIKALNNLGKIDFDMGFPEKAIQWYEKALAVSPDYAEARFNRALALLSIGDFENGWKEYEWRFRRKTARQVYPHTFSSSRWNGEPYPGKRLLVHCEQGMGDVLQFSRYLPLVKRLGGALIFEAHPPLLPVMESMGCIDHLVGFNPHKPADIAHDLHIPLLSLPYILKTRLDTIPLQVPYLGVPQARLAAWQIRIKNRHDGVPGKGPRVGLIWSGSGLNPKRNLDIQQLMPLLNMPDVQFYSLQTGRPAEQLSLVPHLPVMPLGNELTDFGDTAAIMIHMDLIISVDTAAAHLAGALGKPVWVLLSAGTDWRWPLNRKDSPWYPSARVFRQTRQGRWNNVILTISDHLKEFARLFQPVVLNAAQIRERMTHGYQLLYQGHSKQAAARFRSITDSQPDNAAAQYNLGLALQQQNNIQGAMEAYRKALSIHPKMERAWSNLGAIYIQKKNPAEARKCFQQAIHFNPRSGTYYNLGNTYLAQQQPLAAIESYKKALFLDPRHLKTLNNMARAWHILGRYDISRRCLDKALELNPNYPEARLNSAVHHLLLGDWEKGWQEYSWRFKCHDGPRPYAHHDNARPWRGQSLKDKRILVVSEQGFGDAIQFCRYIPLIHDRGGRVIFEVRSSLYDLSKTLAGVEKLSVISPERSYTGDYEWFIHLADCPRIFGTLPDSVPHHVPYLSADPVKAGQWKSRMDADSMNVGLVWAGSETYPERSCTLYALSCLGEISGIRWHGLQKGPAAIQANTQRRLPGFNINNWEDELNDFSDTAALIANLDLVITIDTSVAHLAGAMGKPTWILLHAAPDWRWMLDRVDSPWYPNVTLFRQSEWNQWNGAINAIKQRLHQLSTTRRDSSDHHVNSLDPLIYPSDTTDLFNLALNYKQSGLFNQAIALFERAAQLDPQNPEIHYNLGNTYMAEGKSKAAVNAYRRVVEQAPSHAEALNNLGLAYKNNDDLSQAEDVLQKAVALEPENAMFHNNLGTTLQAKHKYTKAVQQFKHAIAGDPENAKIHFNLGYSLQYSDALEAAVQSYQSALALKPDFFDAHNNLAITLRELGCFDQAIKHHDHAVRLQPENDDALWNRSLLHLLRGDWSKGWPEFEYRLTKSGWRQNYPYKHTTPRWNGAPLNGQRILVHDEQGYGDTLQFIRYLPLVKSRGGHVILETRQPLFSLLLGFNGIDELVIRSEGHRPQVPCDVHIPLLSLPMVFNTTRATIPGPVPYLKSHTEIANSWKKRIPDDGLKVGFVWAGNPKHQNDLHRSCPLTCFESLFQLKGVRFFSLQKGADPQVKAEWFHKYSIIDKEDRLTDFADTAGLIHHLDLIISVDTAVAHLAGAMGKPVWMLLPFVPDWRWLLDRPDTPWYPSARLFRQKRRGDWKTVVEEVREKLISLMISNTK